MVTMGDKTTSANVLTHSEGLENALAAPAAILRSERGGDSHNPTTGTFSLAFEYTGERSPGCITDTFSETVILDHPFDLQIFDRDLKVS